MLPVLSAEWQQLAKQLEAESLKVLQAWAQALATRLGTSIAPLPLSVDAAGLLQALPVSENNLHCVIKTKFKRIIIIIILCISAIF